MQATLIGIIIIERLKIYGESNGAESYQNLTKWYVKCYEPAK